MLYFEKSRLMNKFSSINILPQDLLEQLDNLSFNKPTQVQSEAIEPIMQGKDVLVQSKTGSGKTLSFGIPTILQAIGSSQPTSLIIAPTRELVQQIAKELSRVASYIPNFKIVTLYGGVPLRKQADSLALGANIIIGTPGRIIDHLSKETLKLDSIRTVVLDEADKMLNMGFYDDIMKIVSNARKLEQRVLFSATYPNSVEKLANKLLQNPLVIKVDTKIEALKIEEIFYKTNSKYKTLQKILSTKKPKSVLIFANTKQAVINLADDLHNDGYSVIDLQGDLDQEQRDEALIAFANGSKRILVATDVASRGLDVKDIELVINYDAPQDEETYTHRVGRTGRADAQGEAITLLSDKEMNKSSYIIDRAREASENSLNSTNLKPLKSEFETICINGGKKQKIRAGDILGTLCKDVEIDNKYIGKIDIKPTKSYIALNSKVAKQVAKALKSVKIKKRKFVTWVL